MFVLGIDPGVSRCGYGCVRREGSALKAVAGGVLTTSPSEALPQRLATLAGDLDELLAEMEPDVVVVERVFFQTNARTAMSVGQASGLALAAAARRGCEVAEYTSNEVKQAVAGYGGAEKHQVQRMVQILLDLPSTPEPPDAADALALAVCHLTVAPMLARAARAEAKLAKTAAAGAAPGGSRAKTAAAGAAPGGSRAKVAAAGHRGSRAKAVGASPAPVQTAAAGRRP